MYLVLHYQKINEKLKILLICMKSTKLKHNYTVTAQMLKQAVYGEGRKLPDKYRPREPKKIRRGMFRFHKWKTLWQVK